MFGEVLRASPSTLRAACASTSTTPSKLLRSSSLRLSIAPSSSSPRSDAVYSAGTPVSLPATLASMSQPALAKDPASALATASTAPSLSPLFRSSCACGEAQILIIMPRTPRHGLAAKI
eukprot:scaffold106864_cov75-Phaeocystis_antarctica.AAC.7